MIWLLTYTGWDIKGKCFFCLIQTKDHWSEFEHYLMSLGNLNESTALFSSAELFFLLQERMILHWIIFLFSKDRKQEASAGAATHARRYLTSLETVLTFWSEIALDPSDSAAIISYTHYFSDFYKHFSYSSVNSSSFLCICVHTHTLLRCPNMQMGYTYRQLNL